MAISIGSIIWVIVALIIAGLVFYLLHWLIGYTNPPEPFNKVARVALAVGAVIVCILILLSILGVVAVRP